MVLRARSWTPFAAQSRSATGCGPSLNLVSSWLSSIRRSVLARDRAGHQVHSRADRRGGQRCSNQRQGNPKRRAQHGTRVEAIVEPARVGNQPGDRCTQGNPRLLNRGGGGGGDVLLAVFGTAHYTLQNKRPRSAYPSSDKYDWNDERRDRSGRH